MRISLLLHLESPENIWKINLRRRKKWNLLDTEMCAKWPIKLLRNNWAHFAHGMLKILRSLSKRLQITFNNEIKNKIIRTKLSISEGESKEESEKSEKKNFMNGTTLCLDQTIQIKNCKGKKCAANIHNNYYTRVECLFISFAAARRNNEIASIEKSFVCSLL